MDNTKNIEGVSYIVLPKAEIRNYVEMVAKEEWEPEDFKLVGDDLYDSEWALEEIEIDKIKMRTDLLESEEFRQDVSPRIENQLNIIPAGVAVPPLILRGSDYLIFDGYARTFALRKLGKKKCLAYIGYRNK